MTSRMYKNDGCDGTALCTTIHALATDGADTNTPEYPASHETRATATARMQAGDLACPVTATPVGVSSLCRAVEMDTAPSFTDVLDSIATSASENARQNIGLPCEQTNQRAATLFTSSAAAAADRPALLSMVPPDLLLALTAHALHIIHNGGMPSSAFVPRTLFERDVAWWPDWVANNNNTCHNMLSRAWAAAGHEQSLDTAVADFDTYLAYGHAIAALGVSTSALRWTHARTTGFASAVSLPVGDDVMENDTPLYFAALAATRTTLLLMAAWSASMVPFERESPMSLGHRGIFVDVFDERQCPVVLANGADISAIPQLAALTGAVMPMRRRPKFACEIISSKDRDNSDDVEHSAIICDGAAQLTLLPDTMVLDRPPVPPRDVSPVLVESHAIFVERLRALSPAFGPLVTQPGCLGTGTFVAGGALVAAIHRDAWMPRSAALTPGDIDVWVRGETEAEAHAAFDHAVRAVFAAVPGCRAAVGSCLVTFALPEVASEPVAAVPMTQGDDGTSSITAPAVSHLQLIYTGTATPECTAASFDLAHVAAFYDGDRVRATWTTLWCWSTRLTIMQQGAHLLDARIDKAHSRGFTYASFAPAPETNGNDGNSNSSSSGIDRKSHTCARHTSGLGAPGVEHDADTLPAEARKSNNSTPLFDFETADAVLARFAYNTVNRHASYSETSTAFDAAPYPGHAQIHRWRAPYLFPPHPGASTADPHRDTELRADNIGSATCGAAGGGAESLHRFDDEHHAIFGQETKRAKSNSLHGHPRADTAMEVDDQNEARFAKACRALDQATAPLWLRPSAWGDPDTGEATSDASIMETMLPGIVRESLSLPPLLNVATRVATTLVFDARDHRLWPRLNDLFGAVDRAQRLQYYAAARAVALLDCGIVCLKSDIATHLDRIARGRAPFVLPLGHGTASDSWSRMNLRLKPYAKVPPRDGIWGDVHGCKEGPSCAFAASGRLCLGRATVTDPHSNLHVEADLVEWTVYPPMFRVLLDRLVNSLHVPFGTPAPIHVCASPASTLNTPAS